MKTIRTLILILMCICFQYTFGQTITSTSAEIAEQFDLQAAINLFGNSKSVEDFENNLNDPTIAISNLDLNGDGQLDYLRCVEYNEGTTHYVTIQACLATDIYQDIATIYAEKKNESVTIQIVGNQHIYGTNYVIEPVYIYRPLIYDWFWGPTWVIWHSPYYWGYYPHYWYARPCVHVNVYHTHICGYNRTHHCSYHRGVPYRGEHHGQHHNDYYHSHPDQSRQHVTTHRQTGPSQHVHSTRQPQPTRTTQVQPTRQPQPTRTTQVQPTRQSQPTRTTQVQPTRQQQPTRTTQVQPTRQQQPTRTTQTQPTRQPQPSRGTVQPSRQQQPSRPAPTSRGPQGGAPTRNGGHR